jgi:hypothetical protein
MPAKSNQMRPAAMELQHADQHDHERILWTLWKQSITPYTSYEWK